MKSSLTVPHPCTEASTILPKIVLHFELEFKKLTEWVRHDSLMIVGGVDICDDLLAGRESDERTAMIYINKLPNLKAWG